MQKKVAIFAFGIGDGYCSTKSQRHIAKAEITYSKLREALVNQEIHVDRLFTVNHPNDAKVEFNLNGILEPSKTAEFGLISKEFFNVDNFIELNTLDGGKKKINGLDIDFILKPEEYEIHFVGIDINGVMIEALKKFKELGFTTVVYYNLTKLFSKHTIEEFPKYGIKFCSYQSYKRNKRPKETGKTK